MNEGEHERERIGKMETLCCMLGFFFFQAEGGIRDRDVTGVQSVLFRSLSFFRGKSSSSSFRGDARSQKNSSLFLSFRLGGLLSLSSSSSLSSRLL